ncbi:hypothetical protein B0H14DRAFT_3454116 [Mycena olivaceomarginata]|nr:hypothetical protein B0H14DRAFT_3454116 [Mycena olivaceomarginata]
MATTNNAIPPPYTSTTPPRPPRPVSHPGLPPPRHDVAPSSPATPTCISHATSPSPAAPRRLASTTAPASPTPHAPIKFYRVARSPRVLISTATAEMEFREAGKMASLLIGESLAEVEDDDNDPSATPHFYRVLGSPCVRSSCDDVLGELVATGAEGLLIGRSLADMVEWGEDEDILMLRIYV